MGFIQAVNVHNLRVVVLCTILPLSFTVFRPVYDPVLRGILYAILPCYFLLFPGAIFSLCLPLPALLFPVELAVI